ncbi:hypothetical protein O9Y77_16435, partial [Acinetobacter baumannii]|nr:hypothetical protein [Acinetobacter baumannii]
MGFEKTTSQILFDNGVHKCISFTSLVKGEGIQANQFLIIDHERAAVIDPGGDLTYVPLTMELNKYTRPLYTTNFTEPLSYQDSALR